MVGRILGTVAVKQLDVISIMPFVGFLLRKEVIQPQVPLRLPCYDFIPVTNYTFGVSLHKGWVNDFGCGQLP